MNIELITIGTEVLAGAVINTNAAFIAQKLIEKGYTVSRQTDLPDHNAILKAGLQDAMRRSRIIITTGGLGPTCDDLTRNIAAELFDSDLRYDESVAEDLKRRYGADFPTIKDQATVPSKATLLKNDLGTAPGMVFQGENVVLILLPGVPAEMKEMLTKQVIPFLTENYPPMILHFVKRINLFGLPKGEADVDPFLRELQEKYPKVNFGIYPSYGFLGVTLSIDAKNETEGFKEIEAPYKLLSDKFSDKIFESESGKIDQAVHQKLIEKKITLAVAESCTGGSLSARLTQIPGASQYFLGGVVVYSNKLKTELLSVSEQLIADKGAVSEEVATAMCEAMQSKSGSDIAVAISGIAGPSGGTKEKPVGTLWCAIKVGKEKCTAWRLQVRGNREVIIERGVNALLIEIYKQLRTMK